MAIPNDVLLAAWAPFGAACLLCLLVSLAYLWALSLVCDREPLAVACSTITLVASLAIAILRPADVSLMSAMKGDDGTFLPWAVNLSERQVVQSQVQLAYYVLYGLLAFLVIVVLPFAYMFLESEDNEELFMLQRVVSALKYIGLILVSAGIVLTVGDLIPMRPPPLSNSTEWYKVRFLVDELAASRDEDSLCFLLSLFTLFGMGLLIVYTGYGLSALPLRLMLGKRCAVLKASGSLNSSSLLETGSGRQHTPSSEQQLQDTVQEAVPRWHHTAVVEGQLHHTEEASSSWKRAAHLEVWLQDSEDDAGPRCQCTAASGVRLQNMAQQARPSWRHVVPREEWLRGMEAEAFLNWSHTASVEEQLPDEMWELHVEDLRREGCLYRLCFLPRPLQVVLGIVSALLGLLLWLSLLLSNLDKAMHSLGHRMGYLLPHPTLPNPLDMALVWLQRLSYSSLDFALMLALLLLLVACTIYGLQHIGICCLFVRMYRLDLGLARPRALLLLCFTLVFVVLALDVLVYSVCPQYATYGSQHFQSINGTQPCDGYAPPEECIMSRSSALLVRYFFKAWIFGAAYYWATWLFLGSTVVSFIIVMARCRQSSAETDSYELKSDESGSDESEDDESKPFTHASSVPMIRYYTAEPQVAPNLSV
ncbi:hypothetical protein V5799_031168 [Amblyomma americanum]|uniref:Lysosomal cobalamin transporter n=1 Tax=Amblyomma americanum TaxID=6943 RepID=A0AAQ4ELL7_AMBAM